MNGVGRKWHRVLLVGAACGMLAMGQWPATAGPLPPACDPTISGPGMPGCPSVLVGEIGDLENPTVQLPDLVPDVTDVYVNYEWIELDQRTGQWVFGPPVLNFDTHSRNESNVPLDIQADDPTAVTGSPVSQCISWTTDLACRQRQPVGDLTWHSDHLHYHFSDYAVYELRRILANGEPDMTQDGLIGTSAKVTVCLIDSAPIRENARSLGRYHSCSWVEQGISPGYADVYAAGIEGQSISMKGLDDGLYALVVTVNAEGRLYESVSTNNRIVAMVEATGLYGFRTAARVVSKAHG